MGETGDSGRSPGLEQMSKKREIKDHSRTNYERELSHVLDSRSGLKMGEFSSLELAAKESSANSNGKADGVGFAPAEPLGKPDDPVDRPVLLPKKREYLFRSFGVDRSSLPVNPCALDTSPHIAGGDANAGVVAYPLYFSGVGISADEEFSVLFDEPDWGANRVSSLPVCFDADAFLASKLGQFVSSCTLRRLLLGRRCLMGRRWCFPHQPG